MLGCDGCGCGRFSTTPNSGILAPGQRVNVNLCMTPLTQQLFNDFSADPSTGKDKFMISSCEAPSEVTEATIRGDAAQVSELSTVTVRYSPHASLPTSSRSHTLTSPPKGLP